MMKEYIAKYRALLSAGTDHPQLPGSLQRLIEKFENAYEAIKGANQERQLELQKILAQTDAVIAASIHKASVLQQSLTVHSTKIDPVKLMAMKAKALRLKWKINQA